MVSNLKCTQNYQKIGYAERKVRFLLAKDENIPWDIPSFVLQNLF
jgi:hypothetical protein